MKGEYEYPEDRALFTADYGTDNWGVYAQVNYVGSFQDQPDTNFDLTLDYDENDTRDVKAFTTLNLQFRYTGFDKVTLLVGSRQCAGRGAAVRDRRRRHGPVRLRAEPAQPARPLLERKGDLRLLIHSDVVAVTKGRREAPLFYWRKVAEALFAESRLRKA